jgi:hypothetical protein
MRPRHFYSAPDADDGKLKMPVPQPLNQIVLFQALYDLRNGQSRRCLKMGFGEQELEMLKQPALVAHLVNAPVL